MPRQPTLVRIITLLLFDPPAQTVAGPAPPLPAFDFVFGRGTAFRPSERDPISWLCARYGLAREPDWPLAALLARSAGLAGVHPVWLCADPVHIDLNSERITIVPAPALALSEEECADLVPALDSHFSAQGLRLFAFDRNCWLINTAAAARIDTQALGGIRSQTAPLLVRGQDAASWNVFLTEAQMLLHAHPVNLARQSAGKATVNSLHLWGGGALPRPIAADTLVASDDPLTQALNCACGAATADSAGELIERMQNRVDASALVVRRAAAGASAVADTLAAIEREWLAPLLERLRRRRIDRLELIAPGEDGLIGLGVTYGSFWKFWKGRRPLAHKPEKVLAG